jgi:hypothetical protein
MPKSIPTIAQPNWGQPLNDHLSQLNDPINGGINKFDSFSQRPTALTANDIGKTYLYTQTGNLHQWDGTIWRILNQSEINVKDYGAIGDATADDTAAIQNAINIANTVGQTVEFGTGSYKITATLTLPLAGANEISLHGGTLIMSGTTYTSSNDQGIIASTLINSSGGTNQKSILIDGVNFVNQFVGNTRTFEFIANEYNTISITNCNFTGFTVGGRLGLFTATTGVNPNSDAQTTVKRVVIKNNNLVSDSTGSGQCPKSFHIYNCANSIITGNTFIGKGNGYVFRAVGGSFDTIPVATRGLVNLKFSNNHVVTENSNSEYCQVAKGTNIVVSENTFDATSGTNPHSFFDFFNCFNVSFTGNSGVGGGLAFFGHADLNSGSFPGNQIGATGFTATGNSIINPTTPVGVFYLGGDGVWGGQNAGSNIIVSDNVCVARAGFTSSATAFIDAFIVREFSFRNNVVKGLSAFIKWYYIGNGVISDNVLTGVAQEYKTGSVTDGPIRYTQNIYDGTIANRISEFDKLLNTGITTERQETNYGFGQIITFARVIPAGGSNFLLSVTSEIFPGGQYNGLYMVSRSAGANYITPISAIVNTEITVTINASFQIVVSNVSGAQRTVKASILQIL